MISYRFHLIFMFSFSSIVCIKSNDGNGVKAKDFSTFSKELTTFTPVLPDKLRATDKGALRSQLTNEYSENGLDRSCISEGQRKSTEKFCEENYPTTFLDSDAKKIVNWLETCIIDYYCFVQLKGKIEWEEPPSFEGLMEKPHFSLAAKFAEHFFMVNDNWSNTVKEWKDKQGGKELLFITAARYLYVTFLLYEESKPQDKKGYYVKGSKGRVKRCKTIITRQDAGKGPIDLKNYEIPSYSCYPPPYGSATATSDYDVGLIGPKSGELLANFNDKFSEQFKKSSEEVFDTNIYAYTLEYAMPSIFIGLPKDFIKQLQALDTDITYQAQDLVSALFKIKKYKQEYYEQLYNDLKGISDKYVKDEIKAWNDMVLRYEMLTKPIDPDQLTRQDSNEVYQELMKSISERTKKNKFYVDYVEEVMLGLLYAAEAYHSRGAARYVVGVLQMQDPRIASKITVLDLWCSLLENWGDSLKEFKHATESKIPASNTLIKMSKYLFRTWKTASKIKTSIMLTDVTDTADLEAQSLDFNKIKKKGEETAQPSQIKAFYTVAKCDKDDSNKAEINPLTEDCIAKMFQIVKEYHTKLMKIIFEKTRGTRKTKVPSN